MDIARTNELNANSIMKLKLCFFLFAFVSCGSRPQKTSVFAVVENQTDELIVKCSVDCGRGPATLGPIYSNSGSGREISALVGAQVIFRYRLKGNEIADTNVLKRGVIPQERFALIITNGGFRVAIKEKR